MEIGENCFVFENNVLQYGVRVGNNVVLWSGNHIGHQTRIGDNCFVSSHVVVSGFCDIGANSFLGVNSTLADNLVVAPDTVIGAGAVVVRHTESGQVYKGNPAVGSEPRSTELLPQAHQARTVTFEIAGPSWGRLLTDIGCDDTYYSDAYIRAAAVAQSGRPAYFCARDAGGAVVFPCVVRELPRWSLRDVTTVALGGPVAVGPDPPIGRFSEQYEAWCGANGVVTTYVRFHPLYANHRYAPGFFYLQQTDGAVVWPLGTDLLAGMHRHHRRLVRKAESATVQVRTTLGPDRLDGFKLLYANTMRRLEAARFYRFPEAYWDCLAGPLRNQTVLFEAALEKRTIAAVLCFAGGRWLHYHLGATADEGRLVGASHLLLYHAAEFGRRRGLEQFHLGSGVGAGGGSLLDFKRRFSPVPPLAQWLGKAVHDPERYLELTGAQAIDLERHFPAYRDLESSLASVPPGQEATLRPPADGLG